MSDFKDSDLNELIGQLEEDSSKKYREARRKAKKRLDEKRKNPKLTKEDRIRRDAADRRALSRAKLTESAKKGHKGAIQKKKEERINNNVNNLKYRRKKFG